MFHGLGQHKEQWEPTLEKLFTLHSEGSNLPRLREAWALDWQSHGEAAVLNEEALKDDPKSAPLDLWASATAGFLKSDLVAGHKLVGVGYSSGTVGLSIIMVEPSMMDEETWNTSHEEIQPFFDMYANAVKRRRDVWASKEAALNYFMGRFPWNSWDPRIVAVFSEHALKPSQDKDGNACVVGKCIAIHEACAFQVNLKNTWDAVEQLSKLSQLVPIHVVYGENVDLMPQVIRDCVIKRLGTAASITTIPDVGHTIMQERPDVVATTISKILNHNQD
ncbi:hypothetical protein GGX14DRAFT_571097 [Mycena pura]|uniref:AB hydrolase-1 domain-containing protein n=1 Tax=Mycena pura TaxID=153505 RepID=A0AAD6V3G1_9AGAR|nr:hypothetical protein GGX14DRAFT_571097 [Mycena pura]